MATDCERDSLGTARRMIEERRNVDGLDRIVRGVLGTWLVVVAVAAAVDGRRRTAATAGVAGAGLLVNWSTRFCGGNALLGIDTAADDPRTVE